MTARGTHMDRLLVALTGSGGAGVLTAGVMLLETAGRAGWYGLLTRAVGPQLRGGEAAALVHLSAQPVTTSRRPTERAGVAKTALPKIRGFADDRKQ